MINNYNKAFQLVIGHEGGFQNDPNDRGNWTTGKIGAGANRGTKYGITAMSYPTLDIRNITLDTARGIYKKDFWDKNKCDQLPIGIDYLVFDISVNHGTKDGAIFLQKAVNVTPDGSIGPATLAALSKRKPEDVIEEICVVRAFDYISLGTFSRYGKGWFRRLMGTLTEADDMIESSGSTLDQSNVVTSYVPVTPEVVVDDEPQSRWSSLWKKRK